MSALTEEFRRGVRLTAAVDNGIEVIGGPWVGMLQLEVKDGVNVVAMLLVDEEVLPMMRELTKDD